MEVAEAEAASLKEQSAMASAEAFTRVLEVLADADFRLRDTSSKKILVEVTLLKAIEARNAISLDTVLKQLNALRGAGGTATAAASAPVAADVSRGTSSAEVSSSQFSLKEHTVAPPAIPQSSLPQESQAASAPSPASSDLEELWAKLVDAAGRASPFVRTYLLEAHPVSFEKGVFTIGFDPEFDDHRGLVDNARNHTLLQTKLAESGHPNSQIKFIRAEAPEGRTPGVVPLAAPPQAPAAKPAPAGKAASAAAAPKEKTAPVPFNKDDFKNDPLIQKALEVFKGQIVEVRS
jgi:DNA polymerase-3 subunit gamma/tau